MAFGKRKFTKLIVSDSLTINQQNDIKGGVGSGGWDETEITGPSIGGAGWED